MEQQAQWENEIVQKYLSKLLPAGNHIYQIIYETDEISYIRVLDLETMKRNIAFPDQRVDKLNKMFKLTEEYMLLGGF